MQHFELKGQTREAGNKAVIKAFRRQGLVPCNLYGCGMKNILFTVSDKDLQSLVNTPKSYIVDIVLDGKQKVVALIHELQWHPVTDICLHVDFLAVDEKKPVVIDIPIIITGHALGVQQGGRYYQNEREIRVCALMKNLPDDITVDISNVGLDKKIKAGEIKIKDATIVTDKDIIICGVSSTRNVVDTPTPAAAATAAAGAAPAAAAPAAE